MPCNIYGPNDNYHLKNSFFSCFNCKTFEALKNRKELVVWGSGQPKRDLCLGDLADACLFFKKTKETLINIGTSRNDYISIC